MSSSKRVRLTNEEKSNKIAEALGELEDAMKDEMENGFDDMFEDHGLEATTYDFDARFDGDVLTLVVQYTLGYHGEFSEKSAMFQSVGDSLEEEKAAKRWIKQKSKWKGGSMEGVRQIEEKLNVLNGQAEDCADREKWLDDAAEFEEWFLGAMGVPFTDLHKWL